MQFTLIIVEERGDERWLLQRALSRADILRQTAIVPSAAEALDYIAGKGEFSNRERFPLPRTILLPATLESMRPSLFIRKLALLSFTWKGGIVLLSASADHPEAMEAAKLGAHVFLRPFVLSELAAVLREIYETTLWSEKAA